MIFNSIWINVDSVEFQYILQGQTEYAEVFRPDGISYSQWSNFWESVIDLHDSEKDLQTLIDESVDVSELEDLEEQITDLKLEIGDRDSQIAGLEKDIGRLEDEVDELRNEIKSLEKLVKFARDNQ